MVLATKQKPNLLIIRIKLMKDVSLHTYGHLTFFLMIYVYVHWYFTCMYVCANLLELEIQKGVSCHVELGIELGSSGRPASWAPTLPGGGWKESCGQRWDIAFFVPVIVKRRFKQGSPEWALVTHPASTTPAPRNSAAQQQSVQEEAGHPGLLR